MNSFGQKIVCLNEDYKDKIQDSSIFMLRGNLISINTPENQQSNKNIKEKARFSFTDCISKQEHLFIDSSNHPKGWLIIDKSRNRADYIDQEIIFVFNILAGKCLISKTKNCGFDVFMRSNKNCGFSEPCYNYENGNISIIENKRCKRYIKLIIDTEIGLIKKPSH